MAINLLPSEEKTKAEKAKTTSQKVIAMTGPSRREKKRSSVKRGGVLTFFKGAFRKPVEQPESEAQVPEQKVSIEEHVQQSRPRDDQKPRITYQQEKPAPQPSTKKPTAQPLDYDQGGFIARFFRREPAQPLPEEKVGPTYDPEKEQFPKYSPIKAEKISGSTDRLRKRHGDVITVTTPTPEPTEHHAGVRVERRSFFARIGSWFRSLFSRASTAPTAIPKRPGESASLTRQEGVKYEVERKSAPAVYASKSVPAPAQPIAPPPAPMIPPPPPPPSAQATTPPAVVPAAPTTPPRPLSEQKSIPTPIELVADDKKEYVKPHSHPSTGKKEAPLLPEEKKKKHSFWDRMRKLFSRTSSAEQSAVRLHGQTAGDMITPSDGLNWEVNLVPEEALEQEISISRVLSLITYAIIAAGLVFGGWFWAHWYYNSITTSINKISNDITLADIQIRSYQTLQEDITALRQQIDDVQTLLDKHVYWSSIFTQIERYTSPDVYYQSMTADVNGSIRLTAVGKNYDAAIKQLMVLESADEFVTSVMVSDIAFQGPTETLATTAASIDPPVTFSITLTITPQIFYFPSSL